MKTQTILAIPLTNIVFLTTSKAEVVLSHEKAVIQDIDCDSPSVMVKFLSDEEFKN